MIFKAKYVGLMLGIHRVCLPQYSRSGIPTPYRAPLSSWAWPAWGRTHTSHSVSPPQQLCWEQYGLCDSFAIGSYGNAFTIPATDTHHTVYKFVEPCETKSVLTLIIKLCAIHNKVCINLSVFQLTFPSLISKMLCEPWSGHGALHYSL